MDKIFNDLSIVPNKIKKRKKEICKIFCDLEYCIDFYVNKMFRRDCCSFKKELELIDILRCCKNKK